MAADRGCLDFPADSRRAILDVEGVHHLAWARVHSHRKRKFFAFIIGVAVIAFVLLGYQLVRVTLGLHQVSAAKRTDNIFIQGNPAGTQTVERQADGGMRAEYSYNDRG